MKDIRKILVADDDEVVRTLLSTIGKRHGIEMQTVQDGREAQEVLSQNNDYDLVILDLLMPHVSGWEVLESIKNEPATRDLPVILLSGAAISSEEKERLAGKAVHIIDKESFSLSKFEEVLMTAAHHAVSKEA